MSAKIIQGNHKGRVSPFVMRQFSVVERGKKDYIIRSFADDEEFSVQDAFAAANLEEPATITNKEDEITDNDYLPPSKLAKAEDGIVGEAVAMPKAAPENRGFVESDMFCDGEDESSNKKSEVIKTDNSSSPSEAENTAAAEHIAQLEARVKELQDAKDAAEKSLAEKDALIQSKIQEIDDINTAIPAKLEEAKALGYQDGYAKGEEDFSKQYEADKNHYLAKIDDFNQKTLAEITNISSIIKNIDESIADTVLGFVKVIVGAERKINDSFAVNLINNNLARLKELQELRFSVNPSDVEVVKQAFPNYVVSSDTSIDKGCVKVHSRIGEVSLDSDTMIADLERQINEEFGSSQNS